VSGTKETKMFSTLSSTKLRRFGV